MTPLEILALIVIVLATIKLIVFLINPKHWMKVVEKTLCGCPHMIVIFVVWAAAVLWLLLTELTIVHIFATMLFVMPLFALGFAAYPKETQAWAKKIIKDKNLMKKTWLIWLIWIALMLWALYTIFL
ncbi:hypothetical protein CL616_00535 [archaeon]|nr:hypothetical protein [archaeon]|tara:strand:- start:1606 stop:1986 length:381 start_codon:yes stop_codon:yes gene_type:complete